MARQQILESFVKYIYYRSQGKRVKDALILAGDNGDPAGSIIYIYATRTTPKWVLASLTEEQKEWLAKAKNTSSYAEVEPVTWVPPDQPQG
jgi:hypothetical protein